METQPTIQNDPIGKKRLCASLIGIIGVSIVGYAFLSEKRLKSKASLFNLKIEKGPLKQRILNKVTGRPRVTNYKNKKVVE